MRGRLTIELRDTAKTVLVRRQATNTVMQTGAELVAELFAGRGSPITHMAVGTSDSDPDLTTTTTLTNDDGSGAPALQGDTVAEIGADAFSFEIDDLKRLVRVRVRATLADDAAVGRIREAGLIARPSGGGDDRLYNRVTFAPLDKGADHEVTMFWEVEFPFGDLQWLS